MTSQTLVNVLIGIVLIGWIVYRQSQWRAFDPQRMLRMALILGVIGVVITARSDAVRSGLTATSLALLVLEAVLAVGVGAAMGALSRFGRGENGALLVRTGALGSALWLVLIAVRVGIDAAAVSMGDKAVVSTGLLLVMFGLNRLGRVAVLGRRAERPIPAGPSVRAH